MIEQIISGGQTGVDRAALDVALSVGVACGGWCPKGRSAEDGPVDSRYPLRETPLGDYAQRTEWNVRDADATLILTKGPLSGGTLMTLNLAKALGKPYHIVELTKAGDPAAVWRWLSRERIRILNVAGPRESGCPGIYREAGSFLQGVFSR